MLEVHAIVFIPPHLTGDADLDASCRTYIARRGYHYVTTCRDWADVEWLLAHDRAQVVVFANPDHIQAPVPAEIATTEATGRIEAPSRRDPHHQTLLKAVGRSTVPVRHPSDDQAVIFVPPGQLDPYGARCAQLAERQGLRIAGVVQDLGAAIRMLAAGKASVLIVGNDDHLNCQRDMRIEVVALQPAASGARRSKLIRRQ